MKKARKHQRWGKIIAFTKQGPIAYDLDEDGKLEIKFEREAARNLKEEYQKLIEAQTTVLQSPVTNIQCSLVSMQQLQLLSNEQNKQNEMNIHESNNDNSNILSFNNFKTDNCLDFDDYSFVFNGQLSDDDDDYNSIFNNQDYFPQL